MEKTNQTVSERTALTVWVNVCTAITSCCSIVSEMTYTVSSGTLNSSIPYHPVAACHRIPAPEDLKISRLFKAFSFNYQIASRLFAITSPNSLEHLYTPSFTNNDSYLQQYAENWISNCKILTRHTNTKPNSQFHIPIV